jgi:hypothetical protein
MILGKLVSWSGDHGLIVPKEGGRRVYVSAADWPRSIPPRAGLKVSYEIANDEALPDEQSCARAVLVVIDGDEANG